MKAGDNKEFWQRTAKSYGSFMKHSWKLYDTICERIRPGLTREMNVLELACGSGQLSFRLAGRVRLWEATDFSENMIVEARKKPRSSRLHFSVQDATALLYAPDSFDAVVISNALHIMPHPELALAETKRVLKPDGRLFAAYCMNEATIIHYCFQGDGSNMLDCLTKGMVTADYHCISQPADLFEMVRLEDIDRLNQKAGLERVKIVASDLFSIYIRDQIDSFSDAAYHAYINYHLSVCERGDLIGATNHSLDILTKE